MKIEYNIPSIMAYYGTSVASASCVSFLFEPNEPIDTALLAKSRSLYCLLSLKVTALQKRLPFPDVMRSAYGWADTMCVCESRSQDASQRTGLFRIGCEDTAVPLGMYPQYAYSMAFFACEAEPTQLIKTFDKGAELLLAGSTALFSAAVRIDAELIHCIAGWDGYSVNCIRKN